MSTCRDAEAWLEWAQAKYDAAQERYAWSERRDSSTMDSYSELVDIIERGMSRKAGAEPVKPAETDALAELADQMETLGNGGFAFNPTSMVEAAQTIRRAIS